MKNDTIICLCETAEEARKAADSLGDLPYLRRFFVLLGDTPPPGSLDWVLTPDLTVTIERARELSDGGLGVGVRTGILYGAGWTLLFCQGSQPPTGEEVMRLYESLTKESAACSEHAWGVTREHLILYGFDDAFGGPATNLLLETNYDTPVSLPEIAQAMAGRAVPLRVAMAALKEELPTERIQLSTFAEDDPLFPAFSLLARERPCVDGEDPLAILLESTTTGEDVGLAMRFLAPGGLLVLPTSSPDSWTGLPLYRRIQIALGPTVLLIGPKPAE